MRVITNEMVDRVAEEAVVNAATVTRYLAGLPIRPGGRGRIEAALRKFRWADLIRSPKTKTGTDDA
jgi:DNA-binding LacI/PurR family transcriptional regulator